MSARGGRVDPSPCGAGGATDRAAHAPTVSIIIPVLDEERCLPRCIEAIEAQREEARAELIVVDGGSSDGTTEVARSAGVRLIDSPRGRGRQMNAGARAAAGSLLVFLPADTILPAGALRELARIGRDGRPLAGGFRQRFDSPRRSLRLVSTLHNWRASLTGVIYGDQIPFLRRELFDELRGFREDSDMEDVELGARLARRTRTRLLGLTVTTSARRFEQAGPWRATLTAALLLASWTFLRRVPRSRTFFEPVR